MNKYSEMARDFILTRRPLVRTGIKSDFYGKTILVTGAGGSIGSEVCRQISRLAPKCVVLLDNCENNLFRIHSELIDEQYETEFIPALCDIKENSSLSKCFGRHRLDFVFHAAAYKHVGLSELHPEETAANNLGGTKNVANMADAHHVPSFVFISTDKAVNPTSVMGRTKRDGELYIKWLAQRSSTKYKIVRFGNVLGSSGSVMEIFDRQIWRGGPVTVTHPDMKRYFITDTEAARLCMEAAASGESCAIFVLDMGGQVSIVDLAKYMIDESGVKVDIKFTKPGSYEKLSEKLFNDDEMLVDTETPGIFKVAAA